MLLPGGGGAGGIITRGWGFRHGTIFLWNLTPFFDIQFKNTSNLVFPGFKVSSESFFPKDFKTGLTF